MKSLVRVQLTPSPEQYARLVALQELFARACNELASMVQQTRIWNRVALHHMAYKALRERFPALGSQMVCNAIYSVSRTGRLIFQSPASPFHVSRMAGRRLPLLRFSDTCPVYFDRHTLSLKGAQVSMFTLDGRMKFEVALTADQEAAFHNRRLLEIVLQRVGEAFELAFQFGPVANMPQAPQAERQRVPLLPSEVDDPEHRELSPDGQTADELIVPHYLKVEEAAA
jgi:hypothetical protein